MLLSADMLCLVQSFQQKKLLQPLSAKDKSSKTRKLPFFKRKKLPYVSGSTEKLRDEKLLHPDVNGNCSFFRKDKDERIKAVKLHSKYDYILEREFPKHAQQLKMKNQLRKNSRQGLKHLSGSAPSVTCPITPSHGLGIPLSPSTSQSRQKKFLRHFDVHPDERVIDYFSCALVADILLQGHLYISKNYFAFYSNVFGYVTKLLIPVSSVMTVTKEKTAFILPNAIGVVTTDDRHVFSSLLSRDTTYKLMVQVWREASVLVEDLAADTAANKLRHRSAGVQRVPDAADGYTEESLCDEPPPSCETPPETDTSPDRTPTTADHPLVDKDKSQGTEVGRTTLPQSTVLLVVATMLLVLLFASATVLMYRVSQLHQHLRPTHSPHGSLQEVQEFLDTNLQKLHKVRQSLEVLSLLMENGKEHFRLPQNSPEESITASKSPIEEMENMQKQTIVEQTS